MIIRCCKMHGTKYSENSFQFTVIQIVEENDQLLKVEQGWLDWTKCYERDVGYNLNRMATGVGGIRWSEESRKKLSESRKGLRPSLETRIKMSATRKANGAIHAAKLRGRKQSDEHVLARAMGVRKRDKWPCPEGHKCRCEKCIVTKRQHNKDYKENWKKLRDGVDW